MPRRTFQCDPQCPNVTRTHLSRSAVEECKSRRQQGKASRAAVLDYRVETPYEITRTTGDDFSGRVVRDDLSTAAMWRPNFHGATLDIPAERIEGAHLPGADLRGVTAHEFAPGVPVYAMAECYGAIVDDDAVHDATEGDRSWLLADPDSTPNTPEVRAALDFLVPLLQWSFSSKQWQDLLDRGYDPDELVEAAQEFPPRNERGFEEFMNSGSVAHALSVSPHEWGWGGRELTRPPQSMARARQARAARSGGFGAR